MHASGHALTRQGVSVLSDKTRLQMLGLLLVQSHTLDELASLLGIRLARTARHLRKMRQLGLVGLRRGETGSLPRYALNASALGLLLASWHQAPDAVFFSEEQELVIDPRVFADWERDIIRRYFSGTRLVTIPARRKNLEILVRWFAQLFAVGASYREDEVNAIIQRYYPDYAFFKKDLVGRGFLRRDYDIFWRVSPS